MLDSDLANLYGIETGALVRAVKRNIGRFPSDFMFQLTDKEVTSLLSQNVIPSRKSLGGHNPYVFTEQGVAMLSSVLRSKRLPVIPALPVRHSFGDGGSRYPVKKIDRVADPN